MAYQVNSNVAALNVYNNLSVHQAKSSASLARISSGLKAAGGGDVASQGTAATLNAANCKGPKAAISQVQSAINQLQAADAAYGELIALGQKGRGSLSRDRMTPMLVRTPTSAITAQVNVALTAGITSIQTNTEFNGSVAGVLGPALRPPTWVSAAFTATPAVATTETPALAADDTAGDTCSPTSLHHGRQAGHECGQYLASLQNTSAGAQLGGSK